MSCYITEEYYLERFKGGEAEDLPFLIEAASDIIYDLTLGKSSAAEGAVLDKVKRATAAEVRYLSDNGGTESLLSGGFASVSIGKFSYSSGSGGSSSGGRSAPVSPYAVTLLESAGLLGRNLKNL